MALMQASEVSEPPGPEAIEELFAALESPLLHSAFRLTGDATAAEDIVQDAFMKLHAQFDSVREPRRWLYRTVHNQALNHRRQAGKIVSFEAVTESGATVGDPGDSPALPGDEMVRLEGIGLVQLSIACLDERGRELIRLKFTEELSYKEISERTGLTVGHVGYLLHHALKGIAGELARNGVLP